MTLDDAIITAGTLAVWLQVLAAFLALRDHQSRRGGKQ